MYSHVPLSCHRGIFPYVVLQVRGIHQQVITLCLCACLIGVLAAATARSWLIPAIEDATATAIIPPASIAGCR